MDRSASLLQAPPFSIRLWCNKFGPQYFKRLKRRHKGYGDTFFIDEVFVKIQGKQQYLWRAVDQDGEVVDVFLQARRDSKAAKRFFRRLLNTHRMRRFKSAQQVQRFLNIHAAVYNLFKLGRHLISAKHYRQLREFTFGEFQGSCRMNFFYAAAFSRSGFSLTTATRSQFRMSRAQRSGFRLRAAS